MIRFHLHGEFAPGSIITQWSGDSRPRIAEIESQIDRAWLAASKRPNVKLFDGPMVRLESFTADTQLHLALSRTSYKPFLGTNLTHPEFADRFRPAALANPIGLSAALQTTDGFIMLGRRNANLAYYPSRVHPFAGALEPAEPMDIFNQMARELNEELGLTEADLAPMTCLGIAEDISLRQPEMIFHVPCLQTRAAIESRLDEAEHVAAMAISAEPGPISGAIHNPVLTPIAVATLLMWGRRELGQAWFDAAKRVTSPP